MESMGGRIPGAASRVWDPGTVPDARLIASAASTAGEFVVGFLRYLYVPTRRDHVRLEARDAVASAIVLELPGGPSTSPSVHALAASQAMRILQRPDRGRTVPVKSRERSDGTYEVIVARELLGRPVRAPLTPRASQVDAESATTVSEATQQILEQCLGVRHLSKVDAAAALGLLPRTYQRRLAAEDTTFQTLTEHVQRNRAQSLIEDRRIPLAQVGTLLGFAEPAAFTHASHRWFGASPRDFRRRLNA
ncbi:MAG: helix-turn-helix domain-containing protein [Actinomycetales bacterium]|nr:MAG: helix-turn-helix domain-containing protein [Actinomycetales bacterium]